MLEPIRIPERVNQPQRNGSEVYKKPGTNEAVDKSTAFQGFEKLKQDKYNDIYAHESAHQSTGGSQAGGIVIEKDANGIAFAGHVPIQMPTETNKDNPGETMRMAETAYKAALAPGDPSGQDISVAAKAQSIMTQARSEQNGICGANSNKQANAQPGKGKNLNFFA